MISILAMINFALRFSTGWSVLRMVLRSFQAILGPLSSWPLSIISTMTSLLAPIVQDHQTRHLGVDRAKIKKGWMHVDRVYGFYPYLSPFSIGLFMLFNLACILISFQPSEFNTLITNCLAIMIFYFV